MDRKSAWSRFLTRAVHGAPPVATVSASRLYGILGVLLLVQVMNIADRELLYILVEPIKNDLGVTDAQMGLLTGFAFSVFYVVAGIPLARAADRYSRRNLLSLCVAVWSGATMICGAVTSFWQLLFARVGVATGEAAAGPAAQSMLADLFPREKRTRAIGIFFAGASAGHFVGLYFGGLIAAHYGWGASFFAFGAAGLLLAGLIWFAVPEPARGATGHVSDSEPPPLGNVLRTLFRMRSFTFLILAFVIANITNFARLTWGPTFLVRIHDMSMVEVGFWVGVVSSIGAAAGNIASGLVTDRLSTKNSHWFGSVPALSFLIACPVCLLFIFAESSASAIAALLVLTFLMGTAYSPSAALVLALAPSRMRALAVAISAFATTLVGGSLGPFLIGWLNDVLNPRFGHMAIRYSFLAVPVLMLLASATYYVCSRFVNRDLRADASV